MLLRELIKELNYHTELYNNGYPVISDQEWDEKYFKLQELEKETGIIYPDSPTQKIDYQVLSQLNKVEHNHPMLSLDKTKDWNEFLRYFEVGKSVVGMVKLDGLTCSLEYADGVLVGAETRGDGRIGEDILSNARVLKNVPLTIPQKTHLIVDGEILCTYADFKPFLGEYSNPRNFASGSIRLLDSKECQKRNLSFVAWNVVEGMEESNSFLDRLVQLDKLGFTIVPWTSSFDWDAKEYLIDEARILGYPMDGLVGRYDDIDFGRSLGATSHHSRAAYAFKLYDEEVETTVKDIVYEPSRTGKLTPVVIFDPIEIDGAVLERASLHNLSVMDKLSGGFARKGDKVVVYRSNQIIPQIRSWTHMGDYSEETSILIPEVCPVCGQPTEIVQEVDSKVLYCSNADCPCRVINQFEHFCCKGGLDIRGLSKATLEKLLDWGWIETYSDLFNLRRYILEWTQKPGFGSKSVMNIIDAIDRARFCELDKFINALGIPLIGAANAKELKKVFKTWDNFIQAVETGYNFYDIPNFGYEMDSAIKNFDYTEAKKIAEKYIEFIVEEDNSTSDLQGQTFVITGSLYTFANRNELKDRIENAGGKVSSSVSSKTTYLINNDINSSSSKNKRAKELNIPIITEEEFLKLI